METTVRMYTNEVSLDDSYDIASNYENSNYSDSESDEKY